MTDRPQPYVRRDPGDVIRSGDWNELQIKTREEIHSHTHSDGLDGALIPREGIKDHAIDGSKIDPQAQVQMDRLALSGSLEIQGQTISQDDVNFRGNVSLGNEDTDKVTVHGAVRSAHSSGALEVDTSLNLAGSLQVGTLGSGREVVVNDDLANILSDKGLNGVGTNQASAPDNHKLLSTNVH